MDVHPLVVGRGRVPGPRIRAGLDERLAHRNGGVFPVWMGHLARP